jgi:hypothetical protein
MALLGWHQISDGLPDILTDGFRGFSPVESMLVPLNLGT